MATKYITWSGGPTGDWTTDGTADQTEINAALDWANLNPHNTICFRGSGDNNNPHIYWITGIIYPGSNTVFTAEKGVEVKVAANAPQFKGYNGFIRSKGSYVTGLEISGFKINGNCGARPASYADSSSSTDHDCERAINIIGISTHSAEDVLIKDMTIVDSFSDGIHVHWGKNIRIKNCTIKNTQHECIFFVEVTGSGNDISGCTLEGIGSDTIRIDNSQNIKIHGNDISPYLSTVNLNGAFRNGENGIQIADEGFSHGGGTDYPDAINNIEVYNNTFRQCGLAGILILDARGKGANLAQNVYIHHNKFEACGYYSSTAYGCGVSVDKWGNGVRIEENTFDGCYQNSIQMLGASGTSAYTVSIKKNNITNTKGSGTATKGGLSSSYRGYGIYRADAVKSYFTPIIDGNYFSGNTKGDVYPTSLSKTNNATSFITTSVIGTEDNTTNDGGDTNGDTGDGGNTGGIVNPGSGNSVIPSRYIPITTSLRRDWIFDGYYIKNRKGLDHTAYVNGVALNWTSKSIESSQSISQEHPAGVDGDNIYDFGEKGALLNLDCYAYSIEEAFDILATMKARTPAIIELGGVYKDYYLEGRYQDRAADIDNTDMDTCIEALYPFSASFAMARSCFFSKTKRVRGRKIYSDGQTWNSDDDFGGNLVRNASFDSWSSNISSTWESENPANLLTWNSVVWAPPEISEGSGDYILLSSDGYTVLTSDGYNPATSDSTGSVTVQTGRFVAVASTGTGNRAMYSEDGKSWLAGESAADNNWKSVCYGQSKFVAVSDTGTGDRVMTSPTGATWTSRTSAADANWNCVCYSPFLDLFCAVGGTTNTDGDQTYYHIGTSSNYTSAATSFEQATSWQYDLNLSALSSPQQYRIGEVSAQLACQASGDHAYMRIMMIVNGGIPEEVAVFESTSTDYATFTKSLNRLLNVGDTVQFKYYLKTSNSTTGHRARGTDFGYRYTPVTAGVSTVVMTSPDGTTWTGRTAAGTHDWSSVCWGDPFESVIPDGLFVAVASTGHIMTSINGVSWTERTSPLAQTFTSVCYSPQLHLFVAVSSDGTQQIITSEDGITWTARTTPSTVMAWKSVTWSASKGMFIAVASSGSGYNIMYSVDGSNWILKSLAVSVRSNCIAWSPDLQLFVAVGDSNTISGTIDSLYGDIAPDGWTLITTGQSRDDVTDSDYGYLITGDGTAENPGGSKQTVAPESGITYVLAGTAYTENLTSGSLEIEIFANNSIVKQLFWTAGDSAPTQKVAYLIFEDSIPENTEIRIQGYGTPNDGALLHIQNVIFEKASDFEISTTGNAISTFGALDAIPDVELISTYAASSSTTVGSLNLYRSTDKEILTSTSISYPTTANVTLPLPVLSGGQKYRIDEVFSNLGTTHSGTVVAMKITIQAPSLYNGVETKIAEWTESSRIAPNYNSFKQNLNLVASPTDSVIFRYYLKTANASYHAEANHYGYKMSIITTVAISGGVSLYNTADPLTVMKLCSTLRPNTKIGINADYTGYYEYMDYFVDDSYLDCVLTTPVGVTYDSTAKKITFNAGTMIYKFEGLYPVTGIPFLKMYANYGCPYLYISDNNIDWHLCDGDFISNPNGAYIERQLTCSADSFFLKGSSTWYLKIKSAAAIISSVFIHADLNTMDCKRVKIRATGQPEQFCALLDAPSNVIITLKYKDTQPVI